ncbi:TetR/AcrR family transcriptional regulator [Lentzea sp. CC55]|uniref:TetR/AcrR family transcriptional regulator n=1 Tax=Lentzea sp. CC55 TaxID=2884909 RepID=UPI001F1BB941|nr:TetR/AcrR family transcriptional regulator [Lentzea sp. CC55]MCG8927370.1 TetR/AcrR family transcriptional regulator [Lentzea sp. CC55]
MTPPTQTRDKERTRLRILETAERLLAEVGGGVSLGEIAQAAGVSKSGLAHHFPSREQLLAAVAGHGAEALRREVMAHVDLSENRAGKLARAYVRALTSGGVDARRLFGPSFLWAAVGRFPAVDEVCERDANEWSRAFAGDGLDPTHILLIRLAAEGVAGSLGSPYLSEEQRLAVRDRLLAMCEPDWPGASSP